MSAIAIGAAALLIVAPGALVAGAIGLRGLAAIGLAGPFGVALSAGTAVLAAFAGLPFWWFSPILLAAVVASLGFLLRRRSRWEPGVFVAGDLVVLAAVGASAVVSGFVAFTGLDLGSVNSTYDGVFHLNAVAWILDTGNGSSLDLYRMTHPGGDLLEFYPAAWHDLVAATVQLTGASIPLATNATWVAVTATVWVPGVALLSAVAFSGSGHAAKRRIATAVAGALLASAFAAAPYLLLDWGTLFPTGLAYALLPAGLTLAVLILRTAPQPDPLPIAVLLAASAVWLAASTLAHPRSLFSFAILAAPLVVLAAWRAAARGWSTPHGRRRVLVLLTAGALLGSALAVAGWLYVYRAFDVANRPISDHLNGGPATARQDLGTSFLQALLGAPVVSPTETAAAPAIVLAVVVIAGLVLAVVRREWRWAVAAWIVVAVLYSLAAGSNSDLAKLATGIWYKDKYRLMALLPVVAAPLAAGTLVFLAESFTRRRTALLVPVAAALAAVVAATSWLGPGLTQLRAGIAEQHAISRDGDGRLLDSDELELLEDLPDVLPEDAVIVGNPWNGSVLAWAVGRREVLFPHLTGDWGADRSLVMARLDQIATDPTVCEALDRLHAQYFLTGPGLLWNGDPQASSFAALDRADPAALGEEVARVGDAALYRITACG